MPFLQTTYTERHERFTLGMIATTGVKDVVSKVYEDAANLPFGRGLTQGVADEGCRLGGTVFLGISVSTKVLDPNSATDEYVQRDTVALMRKGTIVVQTTANTNAGDAVHVDLATGIVSNAGGFTIPGAYFETSAQANELARIYLG